MKENGYLLNKRVLVTGGASGIGLCTAREFAKYGSVPILVDINRSALDKAVDDFKSKGLTAYGYEADITSKERLNELRSELRENGLLPDILVNSAGITLVGHFNAHTKEDWEKMFSINVMGVLNLIQTFLPHLEVMGGGHIVNIGSVDGLLPIPSQSAYCASKFAVTGLTEVLYFDLRKTGVGVTLVCPGFVKTPMAAAFPLRDINVDFKWAKTAFKMMDRISSTPENIARHIVDAVIKDKYLVIPGLPSRSFYWFRRHFPTLATKAGFSASRWFALARRLLPKPHPKLQTR